MSLVLVTPSGQDPLRWPPCGSAVNYATRRRSPATSTLSSMRGGRQLWSIALFIQKGMPEARGMRTRTLGASERERAEVALHIVGRKVRAPAIHCPGPSVREFFL